MFHGEGFHLLQGADLADTHISEQRIGLLAYHWNFPYGKRCQKSFFGTAVDKQFTGRFGLTRSDLADGFIDGQSKADG
ncbi:hypothetical protein D3C87_1803630 [compost metagenome]